MSTIGSRIRNRREELGLSQDELGRRLGYKSRSSINKIELDQRNLTQSKIKAIADALETTPSYIMGWENQNPYEIPDEENPYELELRDTFEGLDVENQIYVKNWVNAFARNPEQVKSSPDDQPITEGEKMLLDLFRKVPAEQQQLVLQMIRAAIGTQESY